MRVRTRRIVVVTALAAVVLAAVATETQAAFPGQNGKLVFSSERDEPGNRDVYTVDADGSNVTRVTTGPYIERFPRWSPDGKKILFQRNSGAGLNRWYTINADGSGETATALTGNAIGAGWSPDGTRITYGRNPGTTLYVANADGTGETAVSGVEFDDCGDPRTFFDHQSWAPDGAKIAFGWCHLSNPQIATINPGGGGFEKVTTVGAGGESPDWSPDGSQIVFMGNGTEIINRDGTGRHELGFNGHDPVWSPDGSMIAYLGTSGISTSDADGSNSALILTDSTIWLWGLDWQPLPVNSYARPKGAARQRIALVTAYERCAAPDRVHGPPLAFASCSAPQMTSDEITVGTGDSNGLPAKNRGFLIMSVLVGNPQVSGNDADLRVELFVDGLFDKSTLEPYAGEVQARFEVRITDKDNTPHPGGPGAGTTVAIPFEMTAPTCVLGAPGTPPEGTACVMVTELSALLPGAVKEGGRAIWELDDVELWDGGPDGDADTEPNTLFARQGVFVP